MNQYYIIKGMKIKTIYIVIAALLLTGGATAALLNQGSNHAQQQTTGNPLIDAAQSEQDTSFRTETLKNAQSVDNIMQNMLHGDITSQAAYDKLKEYESFAEDKVDLSPDDMQTNKRYIAYIISAEDVIKAQDEDRIGKYYNKSFTGDTVTPALKVMEEKRSEI
jgi:ATP synthase subunit K